MRWKPRHLIFWWLLVVTMGHASAQAQPPQAWGYVGWWMGSTWRDAPLAKLNRLLFFEIKVAATGELAQRNGWPEQWGELQQAVQRSQTPLDLTLTLFDANAFNQLFGSEPATLRLLDNALALAGQSGVAGLQLDFEIYTQARPAAIERYRGFVKKLVLGLRAQAPARHLSVFFPVGGSVKLYDELTLAQVDHVVLQGYDAHWASGKNAGPLAPLAGPEAVTWGKALALGLALNVPRERLLLGYPLYGYEWPVQGGKPRSLTRGPGVPTSFAPLPPALHQEIEVNVQERVRAHGARHDPISASSHYQFKGRDGRWVEGWFEDWWSLGRKTDFLMEERLGGIAFFMLGYDGGQLVNYFLQRRGPKA